MYLLVLRTSTVKHSIGWLRTMPVGTVPKVSVQYSKHYAGRYYLTRKIRITLLPSCWLDFISFFGPTVARSTHKKVET